MMGVYSLGYDNYMCVAVTFFYSVHNLLVSTVAVNEAGDTPFSSACSRGDLEMIKALINKHVDPKSKCLSVLYVVDSGLPQSRSTRLVTLHSLWPTMVDTWKWSSISPSLITVIQKVNYFLVFWTRYLDCEFFSYSFTIIRIIVNR